MDVGNISPMSPEYAELIKRKSSQDPYNLSDVEVNNLYSMINRGPEPQPVEADPNQDLIDYNNAMQTGSLGHILKQAIRK